jgi:PPOX class probable F420-dependent enzyme
MQAPAPSGESVAMSAGIPADHLDLLEKPLTAALSTLFADGTAQTQPVWFSYEPPFVLINTMRGFRKELNLRHDPRATLLVIDPLNTSRWLEVRGVTELIEAGAAAHLDSLAQRYAGVSRFLGGCVPVELAGREVPVIGRIRPVRVVEESAAGRPHARAASPRPAPSQRGPLPHPAPLPASHRDLLERPLIAVLTTLMPDGQPQTEPVWFSFEDGMVQVNTTRERQKGRNLERDRRATILLVDPDNMNRWIEIRGDIELETGGALEHLDRLARRYTNWPSFYGYVHPAEEQRTETRIIGRMWPRRVVCDAIYLHLR